MAGQQAGRAGDQGIDVGLNVSQVERVIERDLKSQTPHR